MAGYNKIILVGGITRDPNITFTASGIAMAKGTLAVSGRGKRSGEVTYINFTAFEKLAEICQLYVRKGDRLLVEGYLNVRDYIGKDGAKKISAEVVADVVQNLSPKRETTSSPEQQNASQEIEDEIPF